MTKSFNSRHFSLFKSFGVWKDPGGCTYDFHVCPIGIVVYGGAERLGWRRWLECYNRELPRCFPKDRIRFVKKGSDVDVRLVSCDKKVASIQAGPKENIIMGGYWEWVMHKGLFVNSLAREETYVKRQEGLL